VLTFYCYKNINMKIVCSQKNYHNIISIDSISLLVDVRVIKKITMCVHTEFVLCYMWFIALIM